MHTPYSTAIQHWERFRARDDDAVAQHGRSVALEHGMRTPTAVVLVHGLSSSPPQFAAIARALYDRGHNVLVPRLPAHGRSDRMTKALAQVSAADLVACVHDALGIARGLGERVAVAGFSLGGLLAAHAAQRERIENVVAVAPFVGLPWLPSPAGGLAGGLLLKVPNLFCWWDPRVRERQQPEHGYPRYATHAIGRALLLGQELLRDARQAGPAADRVTLILNARETSVGNHAAVRLARSWSRWKPQSIHVIWLRGLPWSHDIVEPERNTEIALRILPRIVEAIER